MIFGRFFLVFLFFNDTMKIKALIILFIFISFEYPNTADLKGRLLIGDPENYESILTNTKIILETSTRNDTVSLDKNMNFIFKDVQADTCRIYFSKRTYPSNTYYKLYFNPKDTKTLELNYRSTCPYKKEKSVCPICKKEDKVIPIVYGMIAEITKKGEEKKKEKYRSGGCVVSDCDPHWFCERDDTNF